MPARTSANPCREVDEIVAMAQLVRAQIEAEELARRGAFPAAQQALHILLTSLRSRGRDVAAGACERVLASVADRASYEDSAAFRSSFRKGATRGAVGMLDEDARAVLYQAGLQLSTSPQDVMAKSFGAKTGSGVPDAGRTTSVKKGGNAAGPRKSLTRRKSKRW